jgi:hypothetical protein
LKFWFSKFKKKFTLETLKFAIGFKGGHLFVGIVFVIVDVARFILLVCIEGLVEAVKDILQFTPVQEEVQPLSKYI